MSVIPPDLEPPISPAYPTAFQIYCSGSGRLQRMAINGVPLGKLGRIEQTWDDILGSPDLIGEPIHLPLRPGALDVPQVIGPRQFAIGMVIHGNHDKDQATHNARWRELARLVWSPTKPLTVSRTMAAINPLLPTGPAIGVTHQCSAKYVSGLGPQSIFGGSMSRIMMRFINLDGYWYETTETVATVTAGAAVTLTINGDAECKRMLITFSGGTEGVQTLTNATNGCILSYTGTTSPDVVMDVFSFTAVQGGINVLKNVTHAGDTFWMRLEPGPNALQLTGTGTVTIRARAAYL